MSNITQQMMQECLDKFPTPSGGYLELVTFTNLDGTTAAGIPTWGGPRRQNADRNIVIQPNTLVIWYATRRDLGSFIPAKDGTITQSDGSVWVIKRAQEGSISAIWILHTVLQTGQNLTN